MLDIFINTPTGRRGFDLSDPRQARDFFNNLIVGPHGQTIGFFYKSNGEQLHIKDMNDYEVVGYAYMCMRMVLEQSNH